MYKSKLLLLSLFLAASTSMADDIKVGSTTRSMIVHAPTGIATGRPLVISMHGMNQSASYQQSTTNWDAVADTAKFVVVYPSSVGTTWDISGTSDLDFLKAIITEMNTRYGSDVSRVYLSGFSMGGMMTYHAMNNIADKFAAFGPVSGYMSTDTKSSRAVPLLHVHGTADKVVPYAAGNSESTGAYFPGAASIVEGWAKKDNCNMTPTTTAPYPVGKSGNSRKDYTGCDNGVEVSFISIDGKGHWHSNDAAAVYTTTELWNFFKKFSLAGSAPTITSAASIVLSEGVTKVIDLTSDMTGATFSISGGTDQAKFAISGATLSFVQAPSYTSPADANKDNVYEVTVQVTVNGKSGTKAMKVTLLPPQGPYGGKLAEIPGTIEFENYDVGGNGYAYFDDTPGSETTVSWRSDEDVDIEECTDTDGGYNVGWAMAGEWLEYSVNVTTAGMYDIDLRVACNGDNRTVSLSLGNKALATDVAIPNTAGWQTWQTVTVKDVELAAGESIIRLTIGDTNYVNLNKMTFRLTTPVALNPSETNRFPASLVKRGMSPIREYRLDGRLVR